MSNFLAVAATTAALSRALQAAVSADVPGATVTMVRPDGPPPGVTGARVNIFLYQVSPNGAGRNADLPTRTADGGLVQRPAAAIEIHYLLSFYGDETELEPQRLLGSVVSALHARPQLTRQAIEQTIADSAFDFVAEADLAEAPELVRFTPLALSLEDLSRLWSVFFQTPYTLSVGYQASVLFLEGRQRPAPAPPPLRADLYAAPLHLPVVEEIRAAAGREEPVVAEGEIVVRGRRLRGDLTRVLVRETEVEIPVPDLTDRELSLTLPAGLAAGVQPLQVLHLLEMGSPPTPRRGVESNVAAFVLHPVIRRDPGDPDEYDLTLSGPDGEPPDTLTAGVRPAVGADQRARLELLRDGIMEHAIPAAPLEADSETLAFPLAGVASGEYLVRVRVDGAESPFDRTPEGEPTGPLVQIP